MKKFIILLLLPALLQCKKDPEISEKTCFISQEITKDYILKYERNAEGNLTKHTYFVDDDTNSYAIYSYVGSELVKIQSFSNTGEELRLEIYEKSGNTLTIINFVKQQVISKGVFIFNSNGTINKVLSYTYFAQEDTLKNTAYVLYEYPNQSSAVLKIYNSETHQLQTTDIYTFDDKKNPKSYKNYYPQMSTHNIIHHKRLAASGEQIMEIDYSYTYDENNYPSSQTVLENTTNFEYDCK